MKIFGELPIGTQFLDHALGESFTKTKRDEAICETPNSPLCGIGVPFDCSDEVQVT